MNLTSFYGGPNGQSFYIKKIFTNKNGLRQESLVNDLARGWTSPVSVGEFVMVSYGLPGDNKYEDYKKVDLDAEGKAYNATLWQKTYDETAGNANGLAYKMIASLAGNTPKIHVGDTIVLDPVENPDVDIDITDPDQPELTFSLPRAVKFWYGDRLGKRNDVTYIDTSEEYKDCGVGDYYINKETGFIYLITQKNGNTCTFVFQACFQAPTPEIDTVVISPFKSDGTINEPSVEKRYTNDEKTQWELIFNLPKAPTADGEATEVGPLEEADVGVSVLDEDTLLFDFKIPRGSRIIPAEKLEDLDMTQVRPGDYFLNALTGQLYLLNAQNEWVLQPGTLKGPPGDALHIVKSFELEVAKNFENNLANGKQHIIEYYQTNDPTHEFKSDQLYEITWKETITLEDGKTKDQYSYYWYYVADDGNWGRVELAGGGGANSIKNEFDPEIGGPVTDKTYSVHYINELIKDEPILDPVGGEGTKLRRTTLSTNLLIKLLSWGDYEDALGDLDPVIDPEAISRLEVVSGPSKTVYEFGDTLDTSGMVIRAIKEDNSIIDVDITEFTFKPMILNKVGPQTITVSYKDATITFDVTVNDKVVAIPTWKEDLYFTNNFQSVDDVDVWNNYNKSYMIIGGASSGKNVGNYEATFTLKNGYVWSDGSKETKMVQWGIQKAVVNSVPQQDGVLTYDGSIQTPNWLNYNENQLTISGDTSGTEVGIYNAIFTVKDGYRWFDTDDLSKTVEWKIFISSNYYTVELLSNNEDFGITQGSGVYEDKEEFYYNAIAKNGYSFVKWGNTLPSTSSEGIYYKNSDNMTITAIFEPYSSFWKTELLSSKTDIYYIISGESGLVGIGRNVIYFSSDGLTWGDPIKMDKNCHGRQGAYGNGKFVFPDSNSNNIYYSENGFNWEKITLDDSSFFGDTICYGDGKFIVYGANNNFIFYSDDGQVWNKTILEDNFIPGCICFGQNKFILGGDPRKDYFLYSIDGTNWLRSNAVMENGNHYQLMFIKDKFIAPFGSEPYCYYSFDGIIWNKKDFPVHSSTKNIYIDNKAIFLPGYSNQVFYSKDGLDWIEDKLQYEVQENPIGYINGRFIIPIGKKIEYTESSNIFI